MSGFMNKRLAKKKFLTDIIERFDKSNPSSSYFCEEIVVKSDTNVPTSVIRKNTKMGNWRKIKTKVFYMHSRDIYIDC
jgi:hypothetical protein